MFFKAQIESVRHEAAKTKGDKNYGEAYSLTVTDKTKGPRLDKTCIVRLDAEEFAKLVKDAKAAKQPEDLQDVLVTVSVTGIREFNGQPFFRGQVMIGDAHFKALAQAAL